MSAPQKNGRAVPEAKALCLTDGGAFHEVRGQFARARHPRVCRGHSAGRGRRNDPLIDAPTEWSMVAA